MKCYIIKTDQEQYQLMQVKPELEVAFMKEYAGKIITEGNSIHEVLIKFNALEKNG